MLPLLGLRAFVETVRHGSLTAAADAMAFTLMRTAHSAFVKETEDFSCTLVTPEGVALPLTVALSRKWCRC